MAASPLMRICFVTILAAGVSTAAADTGVAALDALADSSPLARPVSLTGAATSRRDALADVCRQARVDLELDRAALANPPLDLDERVSIIADGDPLRWVIARIVATSGPLDAFCELRGDTVVLTTIAAAQERTRAQLPEWLRPLHGQGLLATVDADGQVDSLTIGGVMSDELLAQLSSLPKLRELTFGPSDQLTEAGTGRLARLTSLEKLWVSGLEGKDAGLGDVVLAAVHELKSLRDLTIQECGTTDEGVRFVEGMPQLTRLALIQEGRLTDGALASIAKLEGLQRLDLTSYVSTERYGRMKFTPEALVRLKALGELQELLLAGNTPPAELFPLPKLHSLSASSVGKTTIERIAECHNLQVLELIHPEAGDEDLRPIARLGGLRRLTIDSSALTEQGLTALVNLPLLEHLSIRTFRCGDKGLAQVARIKSLRQFDLRMYGPADWFPPMEYTGHGLAQLRNLPKLRTLSLECTRLNDPVSGLKQLTQLRQLNVMYGLSDSQLDELEAALPQAIISGSPSLKRLPKHVRERRLK